MRKTLLLTTILTALAFGPAAAQQSAAPAAETTAAAAQHADTVLIRSIQRALVARGYFDGPVTGSVDAATEDAIRRYQTDHGLTVDGVAGHALANHIRTGQTVAQANAQRRQDYASGVGVALLAPEYAVSTADRWIALGQTVMAKAGVYDGPVNGIYDRPTREAVLRVEADNGLPATGRVSDVLVQLLTGVVTPEEAQRLAVSVPPVAEPRQAWNHDYGWRYGTEQPYRHPYWNQDPGYPWPYANPWRGYPYGHRYYRQGWGGGTGMPGGSWGSVGQ